MTAHLTVTAFRGTVFSHHGTYCQCFTKLLQSLPQLQDLYALMRCKITVTYPLLPPTPPPPLNCPPSSPLYKVKRIIWFFPLFIYTLSCKRFRSCVYSTWKALFEHQFSSWTRSTLTCALFHSMFSVPFLWVTSTPAKWNYSSHSIFFVRQQWRRMENWCYTVNYHLI